LFFAVTLAENFSTFGEIEAVKVQNLYLPKINTDIDSLTAYILYCDLSRRQVQFITLLLPVSLFP